MKKTLLSLFGPHIFKIVNSLLYISISSEINRRFIISLKFEVFPEKDLFTSMATPLPLLLLPLKNASSFHSDFHCPEVLSEECVSVSSDIV